MLGDAIEEVLPCMRIDGSTPQEKRAEYVKDFQGGQGGLRVSLVAAGTGITLTKATNIVFAELCLSRACSCRQRTVRASYWAAGTGDGHVRDRQRVSGQSHVQESDGKTEHAGPVFGREKG